MKLYELLSDGSKLYHWCSSNKFKNLVERDLLKGEWIHILPWTDKEVIGTSLTRNSRLNHFSKCRLTFDRDKLAARFKIEPLNGDKVFHYSLQVRNNREKRSLDNIHDRFLPDSQNFQEEFLVGDIEKVHRYLIRIEADADEYELQEYCKKYNIEFKELER